MWTTLILQLLLLCMVVQANVEKVVFLGPKPGLEHWLSEELGLLNSLPRLSPSNSFARHHFWVGLPSTLSSLPSHASPLTFSETWMVLDNLEEGHRYELRLCWSATQPTAFDISLYNPDTITQTTSLKSSIRQYAQSWASVAVFPDQSLGQQKLHSSVTAESTPRLYLHIVASADFFSTNSTLMQSGLAVDVDTILDPYLLNILPKSLTSTAVYIAAIAIVSLFLSEKVSQWLRLTALSGAVPHNIKGTQHLTGKID